MDLSRGLLLLRDALTHHLPTQEQQLARGHAFVRPATAIQRCIGLYTQRERDLLHVPHALSLLPRRAHLLLGHI
jgi:hypothetical protein